MEMQETSREKRPILMELRIPFCYNQCDFCSLAVFEGRDAKRMTQYMAALLRELHANAGEFSDSRIEAIRLDGGTASFADAADLSMLDRLIRREYTLAPDAQLTLRASVNDISGASMTYFNRMGIFRYDFEVMSLDPLDFRHLPLKDPSDWLPVVSSSFLHAQQKHNLGFVLLYGHKDIPVRNFRRSAVAAVRSNAVHVMLQHCAGAMESNDEDFLAAQLAAAREAFTEAGWHEYLPLCFAKPGFEDRFLLSRAAGMDVLGIGMGASTCIDGAMTQNTMDLEKYLAYSHDFTRITELAEAVKVEY